MAYSTVPAPGTELGPCAGACAHPECAAGRAVAEGHCPGCTRAIGYERAYSRPPKGDELDHDKTNWHLDCLYAAADRASADRGGSEW